MNTVYIMSESFLGCVVCAIFFFFNSNLYEESNKRNKRESNREVHISLHMNTAYLMIESLLGCVVSANLFLQHQWGTSGHTAGAGWPAGTAGRVYGGGAAATGGETGGCREDDTHSFKYKRYMQLLRTPQSVIHPKIQYLENNEPVVIWYIEI